ncbi:MAG: hypothetical protein JRI25_12120 [Deltaproteobacteria bacterium]|nr:hypothetical protein [Deltaproteobacteria bacterium]MBW2255330.1 hypothetical protein [Deltaproteobacteria bacterium]
MRYAWAGFILAFLAGCMGECPEGMVVDVHGECTDPIDTTFHGDPPTSGNNWAILEGDVYPGSAPDEPDVQRDIDYERSEGHDYLEFGAASLVRSSSSYIRLMIPVTNLTIVPRCFVKLENLRYLDAAGNELHREDYEYVEGMAMVLSTVLTSTCLGPGQTGYFLDIVEMDYDQIDHIAFDIGEPHLGGSENEAETVPTQYAVTGNEIDITVSHLGGPATSLSVSPWMLVDDSGVPVNWGYAIVVGDDPTLSAGGDLVFHGLSVDPGKSGSEVWAWVEYAELIRSAPSSSMSSDEFLSWKRTQRNDRESELEALLEE